MSKNESDKSEKSEKPEKALFIQRFVAFLIDILLVSIAASIIAFPFLDNEALTKLDESSNEVVEKYLNQEIDEKVYFTESMNITYQISRKNGIFSLITIFLEVLYFVVYQFYNGGQTFGKKLMKIKVISIDKDITMNQMIFRSLLIDSILLDMIIFGFVVFASKGVYFYGTLMFELIQYTIIIVSCLMIMYGKKKRGLHDLISHTEVIKN